VTLRNQVLYGALLAFALSAAPALAQEDAAASCACNRSGGTLVIRYTDTLGEAKWPKEPRPIVFMSLLDVDEKTTSVTGSRSKTLRCRLKHDVFEIKLEPGVPNVNLLGRCGAAVTGIVTVKRNGVVVIAEKWFEELNCFEREKFLDRITFRDRVAEPELHYAGYANDE